MLSRESRFVGKVHGALLDFAARSCLNVGAQLTPRRRSPVFRRPRTRRVSATASNCFGLSPDVPTEHFLSENQLVGKCK